MKPMRATSSSFAAFTVRTNQNFVGVNARSFMTKAQQVKGGVNYWQIAAATTTAAALFHISRKNEHVKYADEAPALDSLPESETHPSALDSNELMKEFIDKISKVGGSRVDELLALEQAVKQQVKMKYEEKLGKCVEKYNKKYQKKYEKYEHKLREHTEELNQYANSHTRDAQTELEVYRAELQQEAHERLDQLKKERDDTLASIISTMKAERSAIFESRVQNVTEEMQESENKKMKEILPVNDRMRSAQRNIDSMDHSLEHDNLYKLCAVLVQLSPKLEEGLAFHDELRDLRSYSAGDPLLTTILNQISDNTSRNGVVTVKQLRKKFAKLKMIVRGQAFVPEDGNLFWHLVAVIVSKASFPVRGLVSGSDPDSILARADYHLAVGDLEKAVSEMEKFTGLDSEILQEWLTLAKERQMIDHCFALVRTHLTNLTLSQLGE